MDEGLGPKHYRKHRQLIASAGCDSHTQLDSFSSLFQTNWHQGSAPAYGMVALWQFSFANNRLDLYQEILPLKCTNAALRVTDFLLKQKRQSFGNFITERSSRLQQWVRLPGPCIKSLSPWRAALAGQSYTSTA